MTAWEPGDKFPSELGDMTPWAHGDRILWESSCNCHKNILLRTLLCILAHKWLNTLDHTKSNTRFRKQCCIPVRTKLSIVENTSLNTAARKSWSTPFLQYLHTSAHRKLHNASVVRKNTFLRDLCYIP